MKRVYDVAIIGGGITGLSSAYYLLSSGKKVILIEKNHIGSGASTSCDDMILLQSKKPGIVLEMAMESLEMYRGLSKDLNRDIEFESRGGMVLIENEEQLNVMEDFVGEQRKHGLGVEILGRKELFKKQPFVKKSILASTYSNRDSQVNALKVLQAFLNKSVDMGLDIMKNTNITSIDQRKDYWKISFDDKESIEAENVVSATGAWSSDIGKMIDIDIPIYPKKGQVIVTEQIPKLGKENIWSAGYIVSKLKPELRKNKNDLHSRLGIGFSLSQCKEGNYFIGSTRENMTYDKNNTFEALDILVKQTIDFFPILKDVNIIRSFAGIRPASEDGKPIISKVKNREGFFIAGGHGGDGIALAPITGKLVSKLVNSEYIKYNMEDLSIERFKQEEGRE